VRLGDAGLRLIKQFEGCKLDAYPDPGTGGEPYTIGYGHTGGVSLGDVITQEQADSFLRQDVGKFERCVTLALGETAVTANQFDACVCISFNIGCGAFQKSTLLRKLRDGDDIGAAREFLRWNKAGGREMAGLTRRRQAEHDLFMQA